MGDWEVAERIAEAVGQLLQRPPPRTVVRCPGPLDGGISETQRYEARHGVPNPSTLGPI